MTISSELEEKILRYYYVEKWRVGTISRQLHIHHSTVARVLAAGVVSKEKLVPKKSMIEPFLPFVIETLKKFPTLTASRLYQMVCERGYNGGPDHFRYLIALHRPRPHAEAYLRLKTLPGEQSQVDWGYFGNTIIGTAKRPVMAFVMVLSYSRKIFLRFYLNQRMANFLHGHEAAFAAFNGVPRVLLYDNLRSAVLERQGDAIRFNPTLLAFAAHYRFEPRPVAVARGNEKGRVERAIRYIRDNFFAARQWIDIDDLNAQAAAWCDGNAANRPCPENLSMSVREIFTQEQPKLLSIPDNPYPVNEREEVKVGKTPYVRFDLNDYSVPHTYVRRTLTVHATQNSLSIQDGSNIIAQHERSYDRGQQIEKESHIEGLVAAKKQARVHRGQHRLTSAVPSSAALLIHAATRGYHLGSIISQLLKLLDSYGAAELEAAMSEVLMRDVSHPNSIRLVLEKRRKDRDQLPPVNLDLPDDNRVRNLVVRPHSLSDYDQLQSIMETETND